MPEPEEDVIDKMVRDALRNPHDEAALQPLKEKLEAAGGNPNQMETESDRKVNESPYTHTPGKPCGLKIVFGERIAADGEMINCPLCIEVALGRRPAMVDPAQKEFNPQPDLRTLDGQLAYLDYHVPTMKQRLAHEEVNRLFQFMWRKLAGTVPDGPGKTRLLHKMQAARMEANCVIANYGA